MAMHWAKYDLNTIRRTLFQERERIWNSMQSHTGVVLIKSPEINYDGALVPHAELGRLFKFCIKFFLYKVTLLKLFPILRRRIVALV